ncbi:MAG TPA: adenylate/guanylate cyclase domain-containing protein [Acidimicrobiales bacterium]
MAGGEAEAAGALPPWGVTEERRHLTVVFSDLVGSTDLASSMDPEDWHQVLAGYHRRVAEVVEGHGGFVSQFQGDGMVAFFGYPKTIGSAGREAVDAALALVAGVEALPSELPAELGVQVLQARVGVHSGEVVVSPIAAGGVGRLADIFGEVPNLAARLQAAGQPGDVLLSDATARLVSGYFVTEPLGALELKGIPRPVPTFRVLGPSTARGRLDTGPLTVFVPRPNEMAWLRAQWDSTARGPARLVLVVGEAGIGKSRLLAEFIAARSEDGGITALYCAHRDALSPLRPFEVAMGALPLTPDVAAQWLEARAERGPALVLVEDAHWADPSTLEAIEQVAHSDRPILVVLTARPEIEANMLVTVSRRLDLDRLSPDESLAMVLRFPGSERLTAEVQQGLRDRADGVPLFLEELTRGVLDGAASGDRAGIPLTLTEVITARLDRLGEAKRVAQMAAIVGRAFDPAVLADASGFERDQLDLLIQRLIDQAVVEPSEERDGRFWFRHALIHEAAYGSVLRSERKVAHAKVADVLIRHGVEAGQPEVVAFHLGAAGRPAEAVEMWHQAARAARQNSRFKEAASHEREILLLVPQLAQEHQEGTELGARSRLTLCLTAVDQGSPEVIVEGMRVQELARRADDRKALLRSFLVLLPWWQANAEYGSIDRALPEAFDLAQALGDEWAHQTLRQFAGAVRIWQGRPAEGLARLEESFAAAGLPLEASLLDQAKEAPPVVAIVLASNRIAAALGCWLTGRLSEAARLRDDTRRFAAAQAVPQARAVTAVTASIFAQLDGDRALVAELAAEALGAADGKTTRQWQQWAAVFGWWSSHAPEEPEIPGPFLRPYFLTLRADRPDVPSEQARVLLADALSLARASGERFCESETLRVAGQLAAQTGEMEAARVALDDAVTTAQAQGVPILELRALTDLVELADPSPPSRERLEARLGRLSGGLESYSVQRARAVLDAHT